LVVSIVLLRQTARVGTAEPATTAG